MDRIVNTNKVKNTDNVKKYCKCEKTESSSARKCFMYIYTVYISSVKNHDIETDTKKANKNVFVFELSTWE